MSRSIGRFGSNASKLVLGSRPKWKTMCASEAYQLAARDHGLSEGSMWAGASRRRSGQGATLRGCRSAIGRTLPPSMGRERCSFSRSNTSAEQLASEFA